MTVCRYLIEGEARVSGFCDLLAFFFIGGHTGEGHEGFWFTGDIFSQIPGITGSVEGFIYYVVEGFHPLLFCLLGGFEKPKPIVFHVLEATRDPLNVEFYAG